MQPKELPQSAFDQVALNGPPNFPADSQPEPGRAVRFLQDNDHKMPRMPLAALRLNHQVGPPMPHTTGGRKRPLPYHRSLETLLGRNGDHQPLAAFGPTALKNDLAIFGLHPATETVGSFTADFARLISAFHDLTDSPFTFLLIGLAGSPAFWRSVLLIIQNPGCQPKKSFSNQSLALPTAGLGQPKTTCNARGALLACDFGPE